MELDGKKRMQNIIVRHQLHCATVIVDRLVGLIVRLFGILKAGGACEFLC